MGTGKSSVGRLLARRLNFDLIDTDDLIEARAGRSISEIFAEQGEAAFREIEREVVADLAQRDRMVISTGGGLGASEVHMASLKRHALVVCLWASPAAIWRRVRRQSHRPLLKDADPQGRIRELLLQREPVYRTADVLVSTDARSAQEVAQHVLHELSLACPQLVEK